MTCTIIVASTRGNVKKKIGSFLPDQQMKCGSESVNGSTKQRGRAKACPRCFGGAYGILNPSVRFYESRFSAFAVSHAEPTTLARLRMTKCVIKTVWGGRCPPHTVLVERTGFEPVTPTLPVLCAPNCANAPSHLGLVSLYHTFLCLSSLFYYAKSIPSVHLGIRSSNLTKRILGDTHALNFVNKFQKSALFLIIFQKIFEKSLFF